jgi:eukaryotic-like serine/threonine-protein kinase
VRSAPALAAPKQLGKYEVGAKIGGGGMATVYIGRATLEDGTEERVALKVIRDELAHEEQFRSMFIDEAKILAQLSHPNVIRTLEYGVTGQHRFIAMELLSGRTYSDVWELLASKGETLSPALAAWICARIAEGLHCAHELVDETDQPLGVIHRDVNPSNIFLTHSGEAKLIDFGLAKARVRVSKSADGIVKGKIPYLAPEQAHGKPIDRRIDVYALGATLWESVTMKRLFKRDTDVDTLRAIREAKVPDVRTMIEGFPPDLWYIIEKSLREDRDARYETADEFRKELDEFIEAEQRSVSMGEELSAMLTRLFPGQEELQAKWARAASSVRLPVHTMPPPAPVPVVSASMLEDADESGPDLEKAAAPAPAPAPEKSAAKAPEPTPTPAEATPATEPKAEVASTPGEPKAKAKKAKAKAKSNGRTKSAPPRSAGATPPRESSRAVAREVDEASPPEETKTSRPMWVTAVLVGAVLLALALAFANR